MKSCNSLLSLSTGTRRGHARCPAHQYLCLRSNRHLAMPPAIIEARTDSLLFFPVKLSHPLQHAGLSRCSLDRP
jgi:hypothetical protein